MKNMSFENKYELIKIDFSAIDSLIGDYKRKDELIPQLLSSIKAYLDEIDKLLEKFDSWEEDLVYRFYHQSFKVFEMQNYISEAVKLFVKIAPSGIQLNAWFAEIINEALSKEFSIEKTNPNWISETRCIPEAFWHCKYFLKQMSIQAKELETAPNLMPSGWAAVLYLNNLR